MTLFRKCLLLLALAITCQILLSAVLITSHAAFSLGAQQMDQSLKFTSRSSAVLMDFFKLRDLLVHDPISSPKIDFTLRTVLDNLLATDRAQVEAGHLSEDRFDHMRKQAVECIRILQEARDKEQQEERSGQPKHVPWDAMHQISGIMSIETTSFSQLFLDEQVRVERLISTQRSDNSATESVLFAGMALQLLLLAFSIAWYKHGTTPKIAAVMRNIQRFSQQQEPNRPESGDDELSRLDQAFYTAASNLNQARLSERDLMERQRDVICRLDENLLFKQINRACRTTFGSPPEDVIGRSFIELISDTEDIQTIKQHFESAKAGKTATFEASINRLDRSIIEMQTAVSWLNYDRSYVCVMHDITARKHADRLQQELLQMISHDMRTPLTTISGAFEIFEFTGIPEETAALLETGKEASAQMMSLVDHFLKIEKIKAGMFELDLEPGSIESLLLSAAEHAMDKRSGRPTAAFNIGASSIDLIADRQRLDETLTDLFTIVLDCAPADSEIAVETKQSKTDESIEISIEPRGGKEQPPPALLDQSVMERLILPLCHMIIELHGGTLARRGASFTISLPQDPTIARNEARIAPP